MVVTGSHIASRHARSSQLQNFSDKKFSLVQWRKAYPIILIVHQPFSIAVVPSVNLVTFYPDGQATTPKFSWMIAMIREIVTGDQVIGRPWNQLWMCPVCGPTAPVVQRRQLLLWGYFWPQFKQLIYNQDFVVLNINWSSQLDNARVAYSEDSPSSTKIFEGKINRDQWNRSVERKFKTKDKQSVSQKKR